MEGTAGLQSGHLLAMFKTRTNRNMFSTICILRCHHSSGQERSRGVEEACRSSTPCNTMSRHLFVWPICVIYATSGEISTVAYTFALDARFEREQKSEMGVVVSCSDRIRPRLHPSALSRVGFIDPPPSFERTCTAAKRAVLASRHLGIDSVSGRLETRGMP